MAADDAQGTMLAIRDIEIYTRRRDVRRGADVVKLPKLSYRMLVVLADAAPAPVTHDELVERVCGSTLHARSI